MFHSLTDAFLRDHRQSGLGVNYSIYSEGNFVVSLMGWDNQRCQGKWVVGFAYFGSHVAFADAAVVHSVNKS